MQVVKDTNKGTVAHFRPPAGAVQRASERPLPAWVVLPRWQAGAATALTALPKAGALMQLIDNAFNYNVHGVAGFQTLAALIDRSDCFEFRYSSLDDAARLFSTLPPPEAAR